MYCSKCGKEILNNEQYCKHCGNKSKQIGRWKKIIRLMFEILMIIIIAIETLFIWKAYFYYNEDFYSEYIQEMQDFYIGYWYDENHGNTVTIREVNENTITFNLQLYRELPTENITATLDKNMSALFNAGETAPEPYKNKYGTITLYEGLVVIEFKKSETNPNLTFLCNNKKEILEPIEITDTSGINGKYHNIRMAQQDNYVPMTIEIQDNKVRYSMPNCVYTGNCFKIENSIIIQYDKQYIADDIVGTTPDLDSETFTIEDNKLVQTHKNFYPIEYTQIYVKE